MVCEPALKPLMLNTAEAPERVTGEPTSIPSWENVIEPSAVYPELVEGEGVAAKTNNWSVGPDAGSALTASVVAKGVPVRLVAAEVLDAHTGSPA